MNEPPCSCPKLADQMRAQLEGFTLAPCATHHAGAFAAAEAAKERRAAEAEADYWRTRSTIAREALAEQREEQSAIAPTPTGGRIPNIGTPTGDPLADSLTAKVGPPRTTMALNSPGITAAARAAFGGAGTADPRKPIDS